MKKFLLAAIIVISVCQLKAQQLQWLKPADTLTNNFARPFKLKPGNQLQLFTPGTLLNKPLITPFAGASIHHVDNMPIVSLDGYDKMPIVKLSGFDKMVVKLPEVNGSHLWLENTPPVKISH